MIRGQDYAQGLKDAPNSVRRIGLPAQPGSSNQRLDSKEKYNDERQTNYGSQHP